MSLDTISYSFLRKCNITISKKYFELRVKSHGNYPSLASLTDTLDELGIKYQAVRIDKDKCENLSFPFLAKMKNSDNELEIIASKKNFESNKDGFFEKWEGVAIMVESFQKVTDSSHNDFLKKEAASSRITWIAILTTVLLFAIISITRFTFSSFVFIWLSFFGIIVCVSIILKKLGENTKLAKSICNSEKDDCDKVLKSKQARISENIDLGDIGLIYFSALTFFCLLTKLNNINNVHSFLMVPTSLAMLVGGYSIYLQWKIIRAWCKFCLIVATIILIQFAIAATNFYYFKQEFGLSPELMFLLIVSIALACTGLLIKIFFKLKRENQKLEIQQLMWKRSPEIFSSLLHSNPYVETNINDNPLYFGKRNAPVHITMVSSPTCVPCARSHSDLNKLFTAFPDQISYSVIFLLKEPDPLANHRTSIVLSILNEVSITVNVHDVLKDWYKLMNIEKWKEKYAERIPDIYTLRALNSYTEWNKANKIYSTPTFYINGFLLHQRYTLDDLGSFIPDIIDGLLNLEKSCIKNLEPFEYSNS